MKGEVRFRRIGAVAYSHPALIIFPPEPIALAQGSQISPWIIRAAQAFKLFILESELPSPDELFEYAAEVVVRFNELDIKRPTVLGLEQGAYLVQALAAKHPKLVRRVVLVDALSQDAGNTNEFLERIEKLISLPLPMRPQSGQVYARSLLHRITCPTLILETPTASSTHKREAELMAKRIPNAWYKQLQRNPFEAGELACEELVATLQSFLEVPAKRPQKNLPRKSAAG